MATKKTEVAEVKKTDLAIKNIPMKNILKESVGVITTFANKEETEKILKKLAKDKSKRITELIKIPELSKKELEEAKAIRAELRDPRYELQNVEKHNTSVLNASKNSNKLLIGEFIALIEPTEKIIHDKIVAEENKIELAKQAEKDAKELREKEIQDKIDGAVAFFDNELEKARETGDWLKYDEFYNDFETNIEDLGEMEFEGTEVLEKYKKRKEEIIELIKKAEEQAATEAEQNKKAAELKAQEDKITESKRRMKAFFEYGFMFNGEVYLKGEVSYTEEEIDEKTPEDFDSLIDEWKKEKEKAEAEISKKEERLKKYKELATEADKLEIFNDEFLKIESEEIKDEDVDILEKKITESKTAAGIKAKELKDAEDAKKAKELKEKGSEVCMLIDDKLKELKEDLHYLNSVDVNEDLKEHTFTFIKNIEIEYSILKASLKQTDESI